MRLCGGGAEARVRAVRVRVVGNVQRVEALPGQVRRVGPAAPDVGRQQRPGKRLRHAHLEPHWHRKEALELGSSRQRAKKLTAGGRRKVICWRASVVMDCSSS